MIKTILSIFVFFYAICGQAQDNVKPCDRSDITQNEINRCNGDEADRQEKKLNDTYQSLLKSVADDKTLVLQIKSSELNWIKFRDSFIRSAFPFSGNHVEHGSMLLSEMNELRAQLTREQIDHLLYLTHLYSGR